MVRLVVVKVGVHEVSLSLVPVQPRVLGPLILQFVVDPPSVLDGRVLVVAEQAECRHVHDGFEGASDRADGALGHGGEGQRGVRGAPVAIVMMVLVVVAVVILGVGVLPLAVEQVLEVLLVLEGGSGGAVLRVLLGSGVGIVRVGKKLGHSRSSATGARHVPEVGEGAGDARFQAKFDQLFAKGLIGRRWLPPAVFQAAATCTVMRGSGQSVQFQFLGGRWLLQPVVVVLAIFSRAGESSRFEITELRPQGGLGKNRRELATLDFCQLRYHGLADPNLDIFTSDRAGDGCAANGLGSALI